MLNSGLGHLRPGNDFHELWEERRADRAAQAESASLHDLQAQIDKLQLICMAMWSILKEKTQTTEEDLLKRIETIDLSDGKLDGKVRVQITRCPQCNRVLSARHNRCLYCGYTPPTGDFSAFLTSTPPPAPGAEEETRP